MYLFGTSGSETFRVSDYLRLNQLKSSRRHYFFGVTYLKHSDNFCLTETKSLIINNTTIVLLYITNGWYTSVWTVIPIPGLESLSTTCVCEFVFILKVVLK